MKCRQVSKQTKVGSDINKSALEMLRGKGQVIVLGL